MAPRRKRGTDSASRKMAASKSVRRLQEASVKSVSCDFSAGSGVGLRSHVGQKGWENLLESADDLANVPLAS